MIAIFLDRIFRAIKIDIDLYEEVEKDKSATVQAGTVVVLSSLAAGVGALQLGASNFLVAPVLSLLGWFVWAVVIYFVGVKLFKDPNTNTNHGELLRTIGFSQAPGLIGSPTEPKRRSDERSESPSTPSPLTINDRIAVGAV